MSGLFWTCIGEDEQLISRCPSFERDRLAYWGGYLLLLIMMLSLSALWFCLAMLEGGLQFQMEWLHVLISVLVATFVGLFAAGLFRLMFSATRSLTTQHSHYYDPN